MSKAFSAQLRAQAEPLWQRIFQHPFLKQLREGTLPIEKFRYYLIQDYHYLGGFARAVALTLAKAPDNDTLQRLSERVSAPVERQLHLKMFDLLDVDLATVEGTSLAPTNRAYINHLVSTAALEGLGPAAAALLPCPWTYYEIGRTLGSIEHPVYSEWAAFYATGFLEISVKAWRGFLDESAEEASTSQLKPMEEAFLISSRYEFLFWDMAYSMEEWRT